MSKDLQTQIDKIKEALADHGIFIDPPKPSKEKNTKEGE